jgi:hypothetical protein
VKQATKYFSVFRSVRINGSIKRPAVCYPLTDDVASAVAQMVKDEQARIYEEEVRFVSGVAVPISKKPGSGAGSGQDIEEAADRKSRRAK